MTIIFQPNNNKDLREALEQEGLSEDKIRTNVEDIVEEIYSLNLDQTAVVVRFPQNVSHENITKLQTTIITFLKKKNFRNPVICIANDIKLSEMPIGSLVNTMLLALMYKHPDKYQKVKEVFQNEGLLV